MRSGAKRTHNRWKPAGLAGALVLAALLAGAACGVRSSVNGSFDRTFRVTGPVRLEITNGKGDSRIAAGGAGEVRIHGELRVKSWSSGGGQRRLQQVEENPPLSQDGNLIRIGGLGSGSSGSESLSIDYTIVVPPDTEVRAVTGSGDLNVGGVRGPLNLMSGSGEATASEIAGDVHVQSGSGEIHVSNIQGQAQAMTGSGNVTLNAVKGATRIQTGSGEIQIENPGEAVVANTGSGSIHVTGAQADLRLRGSSGNVTVDGNPGTSNYWDFRTSSGNVALHVPATGNFRFYAKTGSGRIDAGIPIIMEGTTGKHELRARIGDGKGRVEIETSSGNITLR